MENAVDALKIAAAVLIFIIAIASSFSLFGTAKQTADSIITMRDKQKYLEAAELDNGILYTSSSAIQGEKITGITKDGYRIVGIEDVVSTIYRYSIESYGVTIIEKDGTKGEVKARYSSATETIISDWNKKEKDENGNLIPKISNENKEIYIKELKDNLKNIYVQEINIDFEDLYDTEVGAPWLGNQKNIQKRITTDLIEGGECKFNEQTYESKNLLKILKDKTIVEITNEIDESKYLGNLLQQYNMPTVEIIYIVY